MTDVFASELAFEDALDDHGYKRVLEPMVSRGGDGGEWHGADLAREHRTLALIPLAWQAL